MFHSILDFIFTRFAQFGQVPLCNGVASRAPHFFGFCFPLCYRCLFFVIGFAIGLYFCYKRKWMISWIVIIIALFPMIIDGGMQTFFGIMSTNWRRVVTGSLFGLAVGAVAAKLYMYLDQKE